MTKNQISALLGAIGAVALGLSAVFPQYAQILQIVGAALGGIATPRMGKEGLPDPKP